MTRGEVHRDVEAVLARIDRASSTWRNDSDASRFNRAAAGEWVTVSADLLTLVATAKDIHEQSDGAFDITVGPLVRLWGEGALEPSAAAIADARGCVGMRLVESRPATAEAGAALRKSRAGVEIDLSGIAPGYAVDCIGERLLELGSRAHLVELGGEVRAWGQPSEGRPWRVRLRDVDADRGLTHQIDLVDGAAMATSTWCSVASSVVPRARASPVSVSTTSRLPTTAPPVSVAAPSGTTGLLALVAPSTASSW
jgi:thiamine biosynthesis lipoprotein